MTAYHDEDEGEVLSISDDEARANRLFIAMCDPGDPGYVDTPTRCVRRSSRMLLEEAATALSEQAARIEELERRIAEFEQAARYIKPYIVWTISDESPGYHPTMPSAVGAFLHTFGIASRNRTTEKKDG